MKVKELLEYIEYCWYLDNPEIEFNDGDFEFTIVGNFMVLGPGQKAGEMREQLNKLSDDFELITAVKMRVEIC